MASEHAAGASPINGQVPPVETRWKPGASANPGGRPKLERPPSVALAELNDTPGETPDAVVAAFKAARGAKLCAADHKAIARFLCEANPQAKSGATSFDITTDRLEGKVEQQVRNENVTHLRVIVDEGPGEARGDE